MDEKKCNKAKKPKGGKNPFFGNSLPFQLAEGNRWFKDSRSFGKGSFGKKGK